MSPASQMNILSSKILIHDSMTPVPQPFTSHTQEPGAQGRNGCVGKLRDGGWKEVNNSFPPLQESLTQQVDYQPT